MFVNKSITEVEDRGPVAANIRARVQPADV
jgi:hypothetical protein